MAEIKESVLEDWMPWQLLGTGCEDKLYLHWEARIQWTSFHQDFLVRKAFMGLTSPSIAFATKAGMMVTLCCKTSIANMFFFHRSCP